MIIKWLSNAAAFFLFLISLLPLRILYIFSRLAYYIVFYIVKYRRKAVFENLVAAFPDKDTSEIKQIEKRFFKYFADLIFEVIKLLSASPNYIFKRFKFINPDIFKEYEEKNQSFLMAVGHYGNWEWSAVTTPMVTTAQPLIVYKQLQNKVFDKLYKRIREKSGAEMVEMAQTFRKIIEYKNKLTFTVFAGDQRPTKTGTYSWMKFMHQETPFFTGIEKIAKSTNYPVLFCDIKVVKRGRYEVEFLKITDKPRETADLEITNTYIRLLENRLNQAPEYWLWSHKRWKIKPGDIK